MLFLPFKFSDLVVHHDIANLNIINPVATIGIFDGVHSGHKLILERLREIADRIKGETIVITLWPHPRTVLSPEKQDLRLLSTLEEKQKLLAASGLDHLVILPFTQEFSRLSSCDFIEKYLINKLAVNYLVVGFNHHFGRDREGDIEKIRKCSDTYHFHLEKMSALLVGGTEVSSSRIRENLDNGNLREANSLLGYSYSLTGNIVEGNQLGRKIGFPTANIEPLENYKLIPSDGVYAVKVEVEGKLHNGILNIGYRPTVSEGKKLKSIEVHIINFDQVLYNKRLTVFFRERIREEMRFSGLEELKLQLEKDRSEAMKILDKE
jgi:riboflavin kinase / FMN adenylyltransferase